ncbi:hypothetical protein C8Q79DRAFT_351682 [Trametes meyenii]|nr:hypothetical protein C8Q79DRAFT_351682 [Trametes meyenii]
MLGEPSIRSSAKITGVLLRGPLTLSPIVRKRLMAILCRLSGRADWCYQTPTARSRSAWERISSRLPCIRYAVHLHHEQRPQHSHCDVLCYVRAFAMTVRRFRRNIATSGRPPRVEPPSPAIIPKLPLRAATGRPRNHGPLVPTGCPSQTPPRIDATLGNG